MNFQEEEDMFADFEKTLLEDMADLKVKEEHHVTTKYTVLEEKGLNRICGPAYRGNLLMKATYAYQEENYIDSAFYETTALSTLMRYRFRAYEVVERENQLPSDDNLKKFLEKSEEENEKCRDSKMHYIDNFLRDKNVDQKPRRNIEYTNGTELVNICKDLPKEWTVIQLCKQVDIDQPWQTRKECLRSPLPIFLTLLCYQMAEKFDHEPIKIDLFGSRRIEEALYETLHDYSDGYDQQKPASTNISSPDFAKNILSKLKKLFGPWIVLLSGKPKSKKDAATESTIYANVDMFISKSSNKYSKRQKALTFMVARRLFMLTEDDVIDASYYISNTKEEHIELHGFFMREREKYSAFDLEECFPVILVVDEFIDFFYWEMCNPVQEFTRVDSMLTLLTLYSYHEDNISDGYFNVKSRKGSAVINPGKDLKYNSENIQPFLTAALPDWNVLVEEVPTYDKLNSMLSTSDIYFFSGHGTGFQYVTAYETCKLSTKAVVFLLGCSSVAFKASTGYELGSAAHQYYHLSKSPAVIGNLNLIYSTYAVAEIIITLNNWLVPHFDCNSISIEKYEGFWKFANRALQRSRPSPYLGRVIANYKTNEAILMSVRAMFCYRGLPVYMQQMLTK